jgi:hypothetical protein
MQACTFISKILLLLVLWAPTAMAQPLGPDVGGTGSGAGSSKKEEPGLFDQSTPHLEYGEFNMNEDEDADTMYFQYGRFFGLSLGLGYQSATGNRGLLYTPALPRFDLKVHYWFDFQLAVNLGIFFATHSFDDNGLNRVRMIGYGADLKYSFDVRNAAAPITFSNPFLIGGVGSMNKNITSATGVSADIDSTFSVSFGAGFEFPIVYKKTYFILESRYHTQNFNDSIDDSYQSKGIEDLSGGFFTLMGHFLFTW